MRKKDALNLKVGDKVYNRHLKKTQTVRGIIPSGDCPRTKYPLVELEGEDTPTTYLLLEKDK